MRVLHVCTDFPMVKDGDVESYGGLGLCALQLIKGLKRNGIDVDVISRNESYSGSEIIDNVTRVPYFKLSNSRNWKLTHGLTLIPTFIRKILMHKYDIIHVHNPPAGMVALLLAKIFGIKTVMTMHGPWALVRNRFKWVAKAIEDLSIWAADSITFDSYALKDMFKDNVNSQKFVAIQNAIDINMFVPMNKNICRDELGLDRKKTIYLYSGRFAHGKMLDMIFETAKRCKDIDFIITGADKDGIHDLYSNVIFKSYVSNSRMPVLYNACDGVILPTMAEGMSRALLEAMSCGIAVFASDIPANRETCGDAGKYFTDVDSLTDMLISSNWKSLRTSGSKGRDRIFAEFRTNMRIDKFIKLYDELLKVKK